MLLDWEYAHASDPFWDLAGWSANNDFEEALQHDLLGGLPGPVADREMKMLRLRPVGLAVRLRLPAVERALPEAVRASGRAMRPETAVAARARRLDEPPRRNRK